MACFTRRKSLSSLVENFYVDLGEKRGGDLFIVVQVVCFLVEQRM